MPAVALHLSWGNAAPFRPCIPKWVLILVFVVESVRGLLNWILTRFQKTETLNEASNQYLPYDHDELLPLSQLTPSSPMNNRLQTIRGNLPAAIQYSSLGTDGQEDITCAVCLTDFHRTDRIRRLAGCGHFFHMECLDKWINYERYTCPLCRSTIL